MGCTCETVKEKVSQRSGGTFIMLLNKVILHLENGPVEENHIVLDKYKYR